MNKIKVIDLAIGFTKGIIPSKIKYKGFIYEYSKDIKDYIRLENYSIKALQINVEQFNDEVEIIEDPPKEDKKIEELSTWFAISDEPTLDGLCKYIDHNTEQFYNKINELVRKVNGE